MVCDRFRCCWIRVHPEQVSDKKVITVGDDAKDHLVVSPMKDSLDLNQVWIIRDPNEDGSSITALSSKVLKQFMMYNECQRCQQRSRHCCPNQQAY